MPPSNNIQTLWMPKRYGIAFSAIKLRQTQSSLSYAVSCGTEGNIG